MSLRSKILLILSAVVVVYAGLDHALQKLVVFRNFRLLEEDGAERDVQRVVQAVQNEVRHVDAVASEWSVRSDVRGLLRDGADAGSGPDARELERDGIGLLAVVRHDGAIESLYVAPPELEPAVRGALPAVRKSTRASGIVGVQGASLIVSRKAVPDPDDTARELGRIVVGRFLEGRLVEEIGSQTGIDFDLWPLQSASLPAEEHELLASIVDSSGPIVRASGETLHAYSTLQDLGEAPALLLRANLPRDITGRGAAAVRYGLLSTVFAGLLLMLVLLALLQRAVLRPIAALTEHAVAIGRGEERKRLSLGRAGERTDEIGILAREFDGMMDQLVRSRAALVETARAAGMSEIATGVLHNVGNALNSVNTSATLIAEKTASSAPEDLRSALAAVRESAGDLSTFLQRDPRGPHFLPLLVALSDQIHEERAGLEAEVRSLAEGVDHIQSLIQAQQGVAGRAGVLETVDLRAPIEAALGMTAPGGRPDEHIEIVREYEEVPPGPIDRHRLTEILVNLVQNARQAIQAANPSTPRLTLRLVRVGTERARIDVEDNGVGIAPENLARIFTHGFTTRRNGHGFGLHASANAATEMGGVLRVRSDGRGRGATFELELPFRCEAPAEAVP